jgi:hypothetical protein
MSAGLLAGCLLFGSGAARAADPAQILRFQPKQQVQISTPTPQEVASCRVKWTKNQTGGTWLLVDGQDRPLRRLIDLDGDNKPDVWCYYLDGVEVYREMDTDHSGEPSQYRWLNSGGMKWGVAYNRDHKIGSWKMISAEEVSQEIVQALITKDWARIQALFISESELKALNLPAGEITRILELQRAASVKFQETLGKLPNFSDKTQWVHLETGAPLCLPADTYGTRQDLVKYARGTILCETGGKHDWLQTGEMIKVGLTWRLIDAPTVGDGNTDAVAATMDPALQGLLDQLRAHDAQAPKSSGDPAQAGQIVSYNLARANLLEQIVAKVRQEEREQWIRQIADCLSAAAQNSPESDRTSYQRLVQLEEQIVKAMPGSSLAAYVTFREMQAENAAKMSKPTAEAVKVLETWLERLTKFVELYPQAEDTPEALMQLGMVSEFVSKETSAKKWYARLVHDFPTHQMTPKAQGALRRLDLEGQPLELTGTLLSGGAFSIDQLRGKTVVVYYWASMNKERSVADFAVLKSLLDTYSSKGLALVCVNLDRSAEEATAFLQRAAAPGVHLYQAGELESPLATQYGIMALPNLFLVDKDGKVISRTIQQVSGLEEELKKRLN